MNRRTLLGLALSLALAAPSLAAGSETYLKPAELSPDFLLTAPPDEGSAAARAELAELHRIQESRTPEAFKLALYDDAHEDGWYLTTVLGPRFDTKLLPQTAALLEAVRREAAAAVKPAKARFHRMRPWSVDPTIVGCPHTGEAIQRTSYPSGHATMGYSTAVVMANLLPARAAEIMNWAAQYGEERLVCGHHFRRDIEAGQVLGVAVGVLLVHDARFQTEMAKAKTELAAAGF